LVGLTEIILPTLSQNATVVGEAFDAAKNDDSFYLPPEAFGNPEFQFGLKTFLSPDGKAVRFIITHKTDPATPEGISRDAGLNTGMIRSMGGTRAQSQ
jgi:putative drug exporter of the RND superfamily